MTRTSSWTQPKNTYREVTGQKLQESDKAIYLRVTGVSGYILQAPKTRWFPRSQIEKSFWDPNKKEWSGMIAEWILIRDGFMDEEADSSSEDPGDNTPEAYAPDDDSDIPF